MSILKKFNSITLIVIMLLFIGCDEEIPPSITNSVSIYKQQEMYLYGLSTAKNQLHLGWYDYYGCNIYDISIPDAGYNTTTGPDIQTYHKITNLDYPPGHCFKVYVSCTDEDIEYSDSITINTQPIDPIEDIVIHVSDGGFKDSLTFTHSSDSDINQWEFYHFKFDQNNASTHPHYFDISNINSGWEQDLTLLGWWGQEGVSTGNTEGISDYYLYSKENLDDSFCYIIRSVDDKNYNRNSYIRCSDNYTRNANNAVEIISISNSLPRRIILEWEEYTDPDFYQYILWRSEYENMPETSIEKVTTIIASDQTTYHDRYNVYDGKKWYYKVEVVNQYGKSETSEIKLGITRP